MDCIILNFKTFSISFFTRPKIFEYCCNDTALAENILQAVQTASIKIGSTLIETNSTVEMFIQYLLEPESENDISHDTEHITNKIRKIDL